MGCEVAENYSMTSNHQQKSWSILCCSVKYSTDLNVKSFETNVPF